MKRFLLCFALLASSLAVSPATAQAAEVPQLTDSFDGARDTDPTYGLNDALATRQTGSARGVTYTRVSGSWDSTATPPEYYSQVNHPDYAGKLGFMVNRSAVRLDAPIAGSTYTVSATVDPDPKSLGTPSDWSSIVLSRSSASTGYVTSSDVQLGLTVERNGEVQLFSAGTELWSSPLVVTRASDGFKVTIAVSGSTTTVTVNGVGRTAQVGVADPYLYLGAYVSHGSATTAGQVSTVDNLTVSKVSRFFDSFDGANDVDPHYGLNDALATRQAPLNNESYTRVSGSWTSYDPPPTYYSQVNHPNHPGRLMFAVGRSAVRLNAPIAGDSYTVSATVDPDPKLLSAPADWSSIMLSRSADSTGYVTNGDVQLGLTVARNGNVQVFRSGTALWSSPLVATRAGDGFHVTVEVSGSTATVTVNGVGRTAALGTTLPDPYLYLGAWVGNSQQVSTVDDLAISRVDPYPNLEYYGYFATRITETWGNHIDEARGFANLHWLNVSPDRDIPGSQYDLAELATCPPRSCALYVGDEFFPAPACQMGSCPIDPTLARWRAFVDMVKPYQDRIATIYLKDEPRSWGVSNADLQTMATAVKTAMAPGSGFGPFPIMLTMAGVDVTPDTFVPDEVDWVGVDDYHADAARLDTLLTRLDTLTGKRTYLFPPTVVADYTKPTYDTNAKIQAVQKVYMDAAKKHPSVIAIMNFGVWVQAGGPIVHPYQIPGIWDVQERYGNAVTVKH